MKPLRSASLSTTLVATTAALIVASCAAICTVAYVVVSSHVTAEAQLRQSGSLRTAASILERDLPGFSVIWGHDGGIVRLVAEALPASVEDHGPIDAVGRATGETATLFALDPATGDFWRRTTNIVRPDGTRAVGTALGLDNPVHRALSAGETFRGEAVILGTPYYTIYQPILSPRGR